MCYDDALYKFTFYLLYLLTNPNLNLTLTLTQDIIIGAVGAIDYTAIK